MIPLFIILPWIEEESLLRNDNKKHLSNFKFRFYNAFFYFGICRGTFLVLEKDLATNLIIHYAIAGSSNH